MPNHFTTMAAAVSSAVINDTAIQTVLSLSHKEREDKTDRSSCPIF